MNSLELKPTKENIEKAFLDDGIGRSHDVCDFVKLLYNVEGPATISLEGKWGTGKTFFVKQAKMILDALNPVVSDSNDAVGKKVLARFLKEAKLEEQKLEPYVTAYYDAWKHDNDEEPLLSLLYAIMKDAYNKVTSGMERDWAGILCAVADEIMPVKISGIREKAKAQDFFETQKDEEKMNVKIEQFLNSLVPERGNRLVIFIDELDRCSPVYAVKLLERVKHFFNSEKIIFVFSVNTLELQHTIKNFYGGDFDACRYLDRFFDIPISLPPIDMGRYLSQFGIVGYSNVREKVCKEVIRQLDMSMREIIKYVQMSKAGAYEYTDGKAGESADFYSVDNGHALLFELCIVAPIALGLKITNMQEYNSFVNGNDSKWLNNILLSDALGTSYVSSLLDKDEAYQEMEGKKLVKREDKIKEAYEAIFVNAYDSGDPEVRIGETVFERGCKEKVLKAVCLMSKYTNLTL